MREIILCGQKVTIYDSDDERPPPGSGVEETKDDSTEPPSTTVHPTTQDTDLLNLAIWASILISQSGLVVAEDVVWGVEDAESSTARSARFKRSVSCVVGCAVDDGGSVEPSLVSSTPDPGGGLSSSE